MTVTINAVLVSPNPVAAPEFVVKENRFLVVATTNPILVKTATFTVSSNPVVTNGLAVATNGLIFSATIPIDSKHTEEIPASPAKTSSNQHRVLRDSLNRIAV